VTQQRGLSQFSPQPSVDLRPSGSGMDVVVRYVTRADNRFEMRNKIYQAVIAFLHDEAEKDEQQKLEAPVKR
jgi:hypothetical protein